MIDVDAQTGVSGGRLHRGGRREITVVLSVVREKKSNAKVKVLSCQSNFFFL